ncbi:MAG: hypothetical protein ACI936_002655 [Paraglaciecola sp.]|jgi:hypothetical protein
MYVVAQSVMFPTVPDSPTKKMNVIQATLIFDLPPPAPEIPIQIMKQENPLPAEPEEDLLVAETPAESQIEPIAEPKVQATPVSILSQPLASRSKLENEIPEEPEEINDINDIMITDKNIAPTPNSNISVFETNMARRHLNSFQQQQQNRVAKQASRYYQQHKNSPVIDVEVKNPFITEDEKFRGSLKLRANCSSPSKKTTAIILGFLGGQIDCSKPPTIEGFIQNRINKGSHLSGQNRQQEQKRPQSIVIKEQP